MTRTPNDRRRFLGQSAAFALSLALGRMSTAGAAAATKAAAKLATTMELAVNFSIVPGSGFRVQRPYVAVWLEDPAGNEVRTLSVWANTDGRGIRYLEHLQRWLNAAGSQTDTLLSTVSSPTRNPGSYSLVWDGKTDKGIQAAQGDYYLCIESAREHGPYALVREKVTLGAAATTLKVSGSGDIGDVSAAYRKRA